mgnify:CR=1 FL=1
MPDEIDFEKAVPMKLAAEVSPEKTTAFFHGEEVTPLHPKELTEELLAKYYDAALELDLLSKQVEMMKLDIKELGKGVETVQKGKYIAIFKAVKGRTSFNFKRFVKDKIGDITEADTEKYADVGDPSVRLEVRKLD